MSIGNSITSIKEIIRLNFLSLFEEINNVEDVLRKDPAGVYQKMDYKSKEYYRNKIKELSEETGISEIYIANKALELAANKTERKSHIGYYLISYGIDELREILKNKITHKKTDKVKEYIFGNSLLTLILSFLTGIYIWNETGNAVISMATFVLVFIPISEICVQSINYILSKKVKPNLIPKLNFSKGIPEEAATFVIIPTLIKSKEKVEDLIRKLEVYYLANKSDNIYFALLGDCSESKNETENFDEEIINTGLQEIKKLNAKYGVGVACDATRAACHAAHTKVPFSL
ncbi:MAG: hypothetical protein FWC53_00750 [Firmicutes bacterium]|nr:hypothetical protein [Bacillota bacterium]